MQKNRQVMIKEKLDLQELISDISHQVKNPITNLKMINSILIEQEVPTDKKLEFIKDSQGQIEKLDFLLQSMIKTSRLESGAISLIRKESSIYPTIAAALGGVMMDAEKKKIEITVDCPENITISHDRKWISEAIFNILDNAVKYTNENGKIEIRVEKGEMYTKIDIKDTGKGIHENHYAEIFKRFYREESVHDIEGIGIGLYLSRKIITMGGGYIQVSSVVNQGSVFSIYLYSAK